MSRKETLANFMRVLYNGAEDKSAVPACALPQADRTRF